MRRGDWYDQARDMRATGMTYREIGQQIGVTHSAVSKALNPDRRDEYNRQNRTPARNAAKRAWDREHYRGECEICGVETSKRTITRCPAHHVARDAAWRRKKEIVDRWAAGESLVQIAAALGTTKASIGVDMTRMRREGWDLPYRHHFPHHDQQAAA